MSKIDFDASSADLLGTAIGPYTIVRRLGMGGMAETFVAIRRGPSGFSQRVCLKLVLPFFREDEEFIALFQREARLAAKLRHSNIVGVIDFGEIEGRSYIAMELVDGVDLRVLLDAESAHRLSPARVALLGHDLAAALSHAHNPPQDSGLGGEPGASIVHRDISPSNVLISTHGEIMLSDFGVAKAVTGSSRQQSAVKGKIPYMSPEQLRLEPLDGRADLFGVGVVLFEALCGRRPYEGGHDPATILLILQGEHPPLASLAPGAPPELCALIERLIEPDREKRPGSAAELTELLDPFVPVPRVRRELGKRVAELRPEEAGPRGFGERATARQPEVPRADEGEQVSGIVDAGGGAKQHEGSPEGKPSPAAPSSVQSESFVTGALPERSSRAPLMWLLLSVALLAGGALAWSRAPNPTQETAPAPTGLSTESAVENDSVEPAPTEAEADESEVEEQPPIDQPEGPSTEPAPASKPSAEPAVQAPASLTVIVYPWGDVWINGKLKGNAPLKNLSLKPGRYRISAGQGQPTVTQTIRLRSGQQKRLKLDVTK
jgi:serine/threonine protein kinase